MATQPALGRPQQMAFWGLQKRYSMWALELARRVVQGGRPRSEMSTTFAVWVISERGSAEDLRSVLHTFNSGRELSLAVSGIADHKRIEVASDVECLVLASEGSNFNALVCDLHRLAPGRAIDVIQRCIRGDFGLRNARESVYIAEAFSLPLGEYILENYPEKRALIGTRIFEGASSCSRDRYRWLQAMSNMLDHPDAIVARAAACSLARNFNLPQPPRVPMYTVHDHRRATNEYIECLGLRQEVERVFSNLRDAILNVGCSF